MIRKETNEKVEKRKDEMRYYAAADMKEKAAALWHRARHTSFTCKNKHDVRRSYEMESCEMRWYDMKDTR